MTGSPEQIMVEAGQLAVVAWFVACVLAGVVLLIGAFIRGGR